MREQSFYDWLAGEVISSRKALINLYENRDRILYIEAPALRKQYMSIFGEVENTVLHSELETALLRRKVELIQTAINRREIIDLEKIDEQLEKEREQLLSELEQKDETLNELPQLTDDQKYTLEKLYKEIISSFHPALNNDLTDTQKELYQKALNAFRMQDVDAMRIIYDCLFERGEVVVSTAENMEISEDKRAEYKTMAVSLSTDYTLAKKLYPFFAPLEDDIIVLNAISDCNQKIKAIDEEIVRIRSGFPFNAVETMNNKEKTEEYMAELRIRLRRSEAEKHELDEKIRNLTEGRLNGR